MAQPAFSKQIGVLERRLGIRLVERTSRAVELTPSGQALLPQARAVTEAMADLCHVTEVQSRENSGRIVVGTLAAEPTMPHTMVRGERRPLQRARSLDLSALTSTCRWGRYGRFDGHRVVTGARPTCVAASPPPALPSLLLEWSAVCTHAFPTPAYARSARPAPAGAGCRGFDGKLANRGAERRGPGGRASLRHHPSDPSNPWWGMGGWSWGHGNAHRVSSCFRQSARGRQVSARRAAVEPPAAVAAAARRPVAVRTAVMRFHDRVAPPSPPVTGWTRTT